MLDGTCRDKQVYARIAEKLSQAGYERTASECKNKIKNRFAAIFNIPRNATINPEVEYSVYYNELPGCLSELQNKSQRELKISASVNSAGWVNLC